MSDYPTLEALYPDDVDYLRGKWTLLPREKALLQEQEKSVKAQADEWAKKGYALLELEEIPQFRMIGCPKRTLIGPKAVAYVLDTSKSGCII